MTHLNIQFNEIKYPLYIGIDILPKIGELFQLYKLGTKIALIADKNLKGGYTKTITESFKKIGVPVTEYFVTAEEASKNLKTVQNICGKLIGKRDENPDTIVAFGGGIATDIAGFTSAILNRNIKHIQIPTSLTAQIDSCISKKAYLNLNTKRNVLSLTNQINLVWTDIGILRSLPAREYTSSLGFIGSYGMAFMVPFPSPAIITP